MSRLDEIEARLEAELGQEWTYRQIAEWIVSTFTQEDGNLVEQGAAGIAGALCFLEMLANPEDAESGNVLRWLNAERTKRQRAGWHHDIVHVAGVGARTGRGDL
jgi:hypothetical protein